MDYKIMSSFTITINHDASTRSKLDELGRVKEHTTPWLIKRVIKEYVSREEKVQKLNEETLSRYEEISQGNFVEHQVAADILNKWGKGT